MARQPLDRIVHESLRLTTLVIACLLAFFVVVDPLINPLPQGWRIAALDAVAAVVFAGAHVQYRRGRIGPEAAQPVAAALASLVALTTLHDMWLLSAPSETAYLLLVLVGAGSILLSYRALAAVLAFAFAGWGLVAATRPAPGWTTFGFALVAGAVLAVLVMAVRIHAYRRLEARTREVEEQREMLRAANVALQESEERYRQLVEHAPDAFVVQAAGRIAYVNAAAVRLLGASRAEDLVGRDVRSLLHPDEALVGIDFEGEPVELRLLRLDGTPVEVEAHTQAARYIGGPARQTILRDITDRRRAETQRVLAERHLGEIERLKETDRMRTRFLNTISHELRTPLTPVRVQLHLMRSGPASPDKHQRALDVLDRNVTRLGRLVDDLLDVASIQAGALRLQREEVAVADTLQQAVDSFADVARLQGVRLGLRADPNLRVQGDPRRLTQVAYNLIGNALKFTPEGGAILVQARRDGMDALVSVTDDGAGLPPDAAARLFEPFSQVHDTTRMTKSGTGLGLYICKAIVQGHGGRIWCESEGPGEGSTFAFTVPTA